jgi:hypothetical protein
MNGDRMNLDPWILLRRISNDSRIDLGFELRGLVDAALNSRSLPLTHPQAMLMALLADRRDGLTSREIGELLPCDYVGARVLVRALRNKGLIRDSGVRRFNGERGGRDGVVWTR